MSKTEETKLPIHSTITVVVDSESLAEGACQDEVEHKQEHRQGEVASQGEEVEVPAFQGEEEVEVPSSSAQAEVAPLVSAQTAVEPHTAVADHQV